MTQTASLIWSILWRIVAGIMSCLCVIVVIMALPGILGSEGSQLRHWIVFVPALAGAVLLPILIFDRGRRK